MALPEFLQGFDDDAVSGLLKTGTISSSFDSFNNIRIDHDESTVSASLISIPLIAPIYDTSKVEEKLDVEFKEFSQTEVTTENTPEVIQQQTEQIEESQEVISQLEEELESLNKIIDDGLTDKSTIENQRSLIIDLRIQNGEGQNFSDFSTEFPYVSLLRD